MSLDKPPMHVVDRARSLVPGRDHGRQLASGSPRRDVLTAAGRWGHSRRSAGYRPGRVLGCTVGATVARYYDPTTAQFLIRDPVPLNNGDHGARSRVQATWRYS
jgi:hypothetical protein